MTDGTPTWIWCGAVDGSLYVRARHGPASRWYQAAMRQGAGRITAAGATREVRFEPAGEALGDRIDAAYRAKYPGSRYLESMLGAGPRAATVRIAPRDAGPLRRPGGGRGPQPRNRRASTSTAKAGETWRRLG